jgi:hypothetical protein
VWGLMMGYMIAKGRMPSKDTFFAKMSPEWKARIFIIFGMMLAAFYHGIYDFNIFLENLPGNYSYPTFYVMAPGVLIAYLMFRDLAWKSYKK